MCPPLLLTCLHAVDRFLDRESGAASPAPPAPPPPHLSSELLRESAGEAELFLPPAARCSSLSRFRFFFCLLLSPCGSRGEPGVEESGVLEVSESRPDTELAAEPLLERELLVSSSAGSRPPSPSSSCSSRTAAACVAALCGAPAMIVTATTALIR